jgi:exodeoxyribonuclease VII small subunit
VTRKARNPDFEKSLQELEQLVEKLERGDLPLDESMQTFERGFALARDCQAALQQAQARVEILTRRTAAAEPEPFDPDADDAAADGASSD